ncbi:MAG: hypothetical protein NC826_05510 [Candidatus Omnitrophica bacterium]|nr:hypothetical protein [Candidatus Omnitrophota bacterium]
MFTKFLKTERIMRLGILQTLIFSLFLLFILLFIKEAYADDSPVSTLGTQLRVIHITYNEYGIAIGQTQEIDGEVITRSDLYFLDVNGDGKYTEGVDHLLVKTEVGIDENGDGTPDKTETKYYYLKPDGSDEDTLPDREYVDPNDARFKKIEKGSISINKTHTVTTSTFHNGNLRTDTALTTSESYIYVDQNGDGEADDINGDGKVDDQDKILTSRSQTTDTYHYDANGNLTSVIGSGTYEQWTTYTDNNGRRVHYCSGRGTITREYEIRDGQALLIKTVSQGDIFDKDGKDVGDSITIDTTTEWEYLGGQWVAKKQNTVSVTISHEAKSQPTRALSGEALNKILQGTATIAEIKQAIENAGINIRDISRIEKNVTYTRNSAGVVTGIDLAYVDYVTEGGKKIPKSYQIDHSNGGWQLFLITQAPAQGNNDPDDTNHDGKKEWAKVKYDEKMGWYIAEEWMAWKLINDADWSGGTWGDPAVTGTVYQQNGTWYMNVQVWSDSQQHWETTTIELNLDALSPEQRQALEQILQTYANSQETITLYGMTAGHVINEGTKLVVMGLGRSNFSAHPFDFEGDIPDVLEGGIDEDFAEFVSAMINSPFANEVLGSLSQDARYTTLSELYDALAWDKSLKIGGSFTTSTGITFTLVREENGARLDATINGKTYQFRHLSENLCRQLGL